MGDPKKHRKKYSTPIHPWQKFRIKQEKVLTENYGLKNKKEIWKMVSKLRGFSRQARSLIANQTAQGAKERGQLITRLQSLNMLPEDANLDNVLGLTHEDIMERRLQTIVVRKGLAKSMKQSRQMIVHGHIAIGNQKFTIPSYLVKGAEEEHIRVIPGSSYENQEDEK